MALVFPISASVGQTYQSGSSNTYEWTGDYWKIKNVINFNQFSASIDNRINAATNEGQFATTGSNTFVGGQIAPSFTSDQITANDRAYLRTIDGISNTPIDVVAPISLSGSLNISGSIIPATGNGTFTSSFSLGSPTNAWKDLYLSHGSIIFVDAITRATSSFSIENNAGGTDTVKYTAAITASRYLGDGSRLTNLPSTTNWNKDKEYVLRNTEQLTFSGDYILENCDLYIDGGVANTIGNWIPVNFNGDGSITRISDNTYRIDGPNDNNADGWLFIKKYFDTTNTMSVDYSWSNSDEPGHDWPIYDVSEQEPEEVDIVNRLDDTNVQTETGTWTINVPANRWVAIGVYSTDSSAGSGSLSVTLPYLPNEDSVQYSTNKYFKKEGKIFIGGNLLVKDSYIENNGQISVGGEVILIGNSRIVGTGTII